jgi:hypothetical protein
MLSLPLHALDRPAVLALPVLGLVLQLDMLLLRQRHVLRREWHRPCGIPRCINIHDTGRRIHGLHRSPISAPCPAISALAPPADSYGVTEYLLRVGLRHCLPECWLWPWSCRSPSTAAVGASRPQQSFLAPRRAVLRPLDSGCGPSTAAIERAASTTSRSLRRNARPQRRTGLEGSADIETATPPAPRAEMRGKCDGMLLPRRHWRISQGAPRFNRVAECWCDRSMGIHSACRGSRFKAHRFGDRAGWMSASR